MFCGCLFKDCSSSSFSVTLRCEVFRPTVPTGCTSLLLPWTRDSCAWCWHNNIQSPGSLSPCVGFHHWAFSLCWCATDLRSFGKGGISCLDCTCEWASWPRACGEQPWAGTPRGCPGVHVGKEITHLELLLQGPLRSSFPHLMQQLRRNRTVLCGFYERAVSPRAPRGSCERDRSPQPGHQCCQSRPGAAWPTVMPTWLGAAGTLHGQAGGSGNRGALCPPDFPAPPLLHRGSMCSK